MTVSTAQKVATTSTEQGAVAQVTEEFTPTALAEYIEALLAHEIKMSLMIWGPPGVGKSEIVAQVARRHDPPLPVRDLRLSQLAPTDLRGLPVPDHAAKQARWYPPAFLPGPNEPKGVLFLDEMNQAPPAIQAIAQQLVLDRRVGEYVLPADWYIWAAGNRKEDRAAVFEMPAPLGNRFLHLHVRADLESFRSYALGQMAAERIHEHVIAFLSFKPDLLHKVDPQGVAWPSPRTWEMASRLHRYGLSIVPAVGIGPASEFAAFLEVYRTLPDIDRVLAGQGANLPFPTDVSACHAILIGLLARMKTVDQYERGTRWLIECQVSAEFLQYFMSNAVRLSRQQGLYGPLATRFQADPQLVAAFHRFNDVLVEAFSA